MPVRAAALAAAALMTAAAAGLLAAAAPGRAAKAPAAANRKVFKADAVRLVEVRTERGDIRVAGADSWDISAQAVGDADPGRCVVVMARHGSNVVFEARSVDLSRGKAAKCHAGFDVQVPLDVPVYAFSGSGTVDIGDREGDTRVETGSGMVSLRATGGNVSVRSGSGSIDGSVRAQDLDLVSGSGLVKLRWVEVVPRGKAMVRTGSGDVLLSFPAGAILKDDVTTGSGSYENEFGASGANAFKVTVVSGSGNVQLKRAR